MAPLYLHWHPGILFCQRQEEPGFAFIGAAWRSIEYLAEGPPKHGTGGRRGWGEGVILTFLLLYPPYMCLKYLAQDQIPGSFTISILYSVLEFRKFSQSLVVYGKSRSSAICRLT